MALALGVGALVSGLRSLTLGLGYLVLGLGYLALGLGLLDRGLGLPSRLRWVSSLWLLPSLLSGLALPRGSSLPAAALIGYVLWLGTLPELWRLSALTGSLLGLLVL